MVCTEDKQSCKAVSKVACSVETRPIARSSSTDKTASGRYLWTKLW